MSSARAPWLAGLALLLAAACGDPCRDLVDKVCGPGEGTSRACLDSPQCANAMELRSTTAGSACSAALSDEDDYPRCHSCPAPTDDPSPLESRPWESSVCDK